MMKQMSHLMSAVAFAGFLSFTIPASAQQAVWQGGGADTNWSTPANWAGGTPPAAGGNVTISGGSGLTVDSNRTAGLITFDAADGYVMGSSNGSLLTLESGIKADPSAAAAYTASVDVHMSAYNNIMVGKNGGITLTGNLTGEGFGKSGGGVLYLGGANSYGGDTTLEGGLLQIDNSAALSSNSNVKLNGGVLGLGWGNFSAALGTGAGEIRFIGDGGFAGSGGDVEEGNRIPRTVTLNGGAGLTWGAGGFVGDGHKLILGHVAATNNVELTNAIDLGDQVRTVQVDNSASESGIAGQLGGVLSGNGGLLKTGAGTLRLTANNTYTGGTEVLEGTLVLGGFEGAVRGDIGLSAGTTLKLVNAGYDDGYVGDRVADTALITMKGSNFTVNQPSTGEGLAYSETIGGIRLAEGANVISTARNNLITPTPDSFALVIGSLDRQVGATVHFSGSQIGVDVRNQVILETEPVLDDGIVGGWATTGTGTAVSATEFVTYDSTHGFTALASYTAYTAAVTNDSTWTAASNIKINASASNAGFTSTLAAGREINSLNMLGARGGTVGNVLNLGGNTLRVESGGILVSGGAAARTTKINNGNLTAGTGANTAAELIVTATGATEIGAAIVNNGTGTVTLVKTGTGILTTTGNNTYTGGTFVNQGVLNVNGSNTGGGNLAVRKGATLNVNGSLLVGGTLNIDGTLGGTGSLSFASGASLGGSGLVGQAITVGSGAGQLNTLSPGNSPGTQTFTAAQTWADGGTYVWELADTDAGAGTGWDWVNITSGALDITAALPGSFTLQIVSLDALFAEGLVADFNASEDYVWTIASAAGGITGFDAGLFNLDVSGFANSHDGTFSLSQSGNSLNLSYTAAVPEPSTYALLALGGAALWFLRRKRRTD